MNLVGECKICSGKGTIPRTDITGKQVQYYCSNCRGKGIVPNEDGVALLKFMEEYQYYLNYIRGD